MSEIRSLLNPLESEMEIISLTLILIGTVVVDVLWKENHQEQQSNICRNCFDEN
ncbi:hypothetical protein cce_4891 [Crocosphaera subtropica ATCC 51142]|uniref:Uncharacterized protein n=1 Tax=Crocosphaera subtropica (strain ATCC 51142 / BH68) TaxID=43989 RepID=B1X276_CROS5|nr:hypothetical protein cce_4891 [Crocosphaera subtropica ATCC 51142]